VFVELAGYGGVVAAPIARTVMAELFNIAPAADEEAAAHRLADAQSGNGRALTDRT